MTDSCISSASLSLPLTGKTILVTRSADQSSQFSDLLQRQGATVLEMPALEITPPSSWVELDQAIAQLESFHWLILSSSNGVHYFLERCQALQLPLDRLAALKIAVVGKKTAQSLRECGVQPDFIPPNFVADSLIEHFPDRDRLPGLRVLFPRVETGGRDVLVQDLQAKGATVVEVAAYQSGCVRAIAPEIQSALQTEQVDVVTFASSKTVHCFVQLTQSMALSQSSWLDRLCIASIGPQTSRSCQELLGRVDVEAQEYTLDGLTQAIAHWAHNKRIGLS